MKGTVSLGERISKLRTLAGLNNAELDRLAGLRKGHTWALERKEDPNPELKTLERLACTLGTTVGYLAADEGSAPSAQSITSAVGSAREALKKAKNKAPRARKTPPPNKRRHLHSVRGVER